MGESRIAVGGEGMGGRQPVAKATIHPSLELSATELIGALKAGDVAAEAYAGLALRRARELDFLNIFVTLDGEQVLESARAADKRR